MKAESYFTLSPMGPTCIGLVVLKVTRCIRRKIFIRLTSFKKDTRRMYD